MGTLLDGYALPEGAVTRAPIRALRLPNALVATPALQEQPFPPS